jgi:glycosyltransferase involved in cell wall biosynthesis
MLAFADEVWVLTRANNQTVIEADSLSRTPGLHFIYYDLPIWAIKLKKHAWFLSLYFILWQWGAYRLAAKHHHEYPFNAVYHVTFASLKFGSFMGRLGIPFVIGPIAGGERAPMRLRRGLPIHGKARELLRDLGIFLQRYSPLARQAYASAERIYLTTSESLCLIPSKWRFKVAVHLAVATLCCATQKNEWRPPECPRFVFAGNLLYFKGIHLAIRALAEARRVIPDATITLFGTGPAENWLRILASRYGVAQAVEFAGSLPRQQLLDLLDRYTSLVFPSLHDSGGMILMEALSAGLPVICLDIGGPGVIVSKSCGIVVSTTDIDEAEMVTRIANAMVSLGTMPSTHLEQLSVGAIARASELSWTTLTAYIAACNCN